eukprot:7901569-Alexandrium_andersonii.AAC.1
MVIVSITTIINIVVVVVVVTTVPPLLHLALNTNTRAQRTTQKYQRGRGHHMCARCELCRVLYGAAHE